MAWEYKREESQFAVLPEGQYRIRVRSAEKAQSKSGNDMLTLQFDVSGSNTILYHYIVFLQDRPEITNRMLTQFYDSFKDIPEGNVNLTSWLGQVGACKVKHEEYNGNKTAKISYFIKADKQSELPPWKEPSNNVRPERGDGKDFTSVADALEDEGLPFD